LRFDLQAVAARRVGGKSGPRAPAPAEGKLVIYAGKRHTARRRQDLEAYRSGRGKRVARLPRRFRKVDRVELDVRIGSEIGA